MNGVPKIIIVPRSADGRLVPPTRFGVLVRITPEGGFVIREGYGNQLNWEWLEDEELLSHQLLCGPNLRSTRVTLDGISSGALDQLLGVVRRVPPQSAGQSRTTSAGAGPPPDPSGLLVLDGKGLLLTPEGLGRLNGFLTTGGTPRTKYDHDAQGGKVVAAARTVGRFNSLDVDGVEKFLSMPARFRDPKKIEAKQEPTEQGNVYGLAFVYQKIGLDGALTYEPSGLYVVSQQRGAEGSSGTPVKEFLVAAYGSKAAAKAAALAHLKTLASYLEGSGDIIVGYEQRPDPNAASSAQQFSGAAIDASVDEKSENVVEFWGILAPFDENTGTHLDDKDKGTDPERYQKRARWAPYFQADLDKLIGKPDPPPEDGDPKPPEPQPPPGGGDPKPPDPKEPDPQQARNNAMFAAIGQQPIGDQLSTPATEGPPTEGIDDGDEGTISTVKDGIDRHDGDGEDYVDLGGQQEDGGGIPLGGGGGPQQDGGDDEGDEPVPSPECPAGGRRKPKVEVIIYIGKNGETRKKTLVDGKVVDDRIIDGGGVLGPGRGGTDGASTDGTRLL
jgi:hypothetical protein